MRGSQKRIGIAGTRSASIELALDIDSPESPFFLIDIRRATRFSLIRSLSQCSAVILMRDIVDPYMDRVAILCSIIGVPTYYFADDNFIALSREVPGYKDYSLANVRPRTRRGLGVIATSQALAEKFRNYDLNKRILRAYPVLPAWHIPLERSAIVHERSEMRVGCFGGAFRHEYLKNTIIPAMEGLGCPVMLFVPVTFADAGDIESDTIRVEYVDYFNSVKDFIGAWSALDLDVVVHPAAEYSDNIKVKTSNAVLVSYCLGAIPVTASEPAYQGLGPLQGVVKVEKASPEDWGRAISEAVRDREMLLDRLREFCNEEYGRSRNDALIGELTHDLRSVTGLERWGRVLAMVIEFVRRMRYRPMSRWRL